MLNVENRRCTLAVRGQTRPEWTSPGNGRGRVPCRADAHFVQSIPDIAGIFDRHETLVGALAMNEPSTVSDSSQSATGAAVTREEFKVIAASSIGGVFEWFDFFLYGSLAVVISRHFFAGVSEATAFTLALLTFAAGFAVRPFGAIVFGYLGDLWGRKNTFTATLLLMGAATFSVGLLPTYAQVGAVAPPMWPSTRRTAAAGSTPAGSRPRPRWAWR